MRKKTEPTDTLSKDKIRYMLLVLIGGFVLLVVKFVAWRLTGSVAVFSDALESIVNVFSGTVALLSLLYASKPKDKDHPYGHGKIEFISAGFEGGLVLMAGAIMIYKGVDFLLSPSELNRLGLGILLVFFAGLGNGIMGLFLVKKGKQLNSATLSADGKHLLTDTYTSVGLLLSLFLIWATDWIYFDGIISIVMGIVILVTGFKIFRNSIYSLLDKADNQKIKQIVSILNTHRQTKWIDIHNFRVQKFGSHLHIDCHVTLPWYDSLEDTHKEVKKISDLVSQKIDYDVEFFIHSDPCIPSSCKICSLQDCPERQHPFSEQVEWTTETLLPNSKHGS